MRVIQATVLQRVGDYNVIECYNAQGRYYELHNLRYDARENEWGNVLAWDTFEEAVAYAEKNT